MHRSSFLFGAAIAMIQAPAWALDLSDKNLTINFGFDVQARAETAVAHDAKGNEWDVFRGANGESNALSLNMRRARLNMDGSYGDNWKFFLGFMSDNADRGFTNNNNTAQAPLNGGSRGASLFKAYLRRVDTIQNGMTLSFQGGMDYPFFNRAIIGDPSWLFAQMRPTGNMMNVRGVGGRAMLSSSWFDLGVDVQQSLDNNKDASNANNREGMFYSGRLEITAFNNHDGKARYVESYKGAEGHSLMLSADTGIDQNNYNTANTRTNAISYGLEALFHWDGLSALAESRFMKTRQEAVDPTGTIGRNGDLDSHVYLAQAGYAFPVAGITLEPAFRYSIIDLNTTSSADTNAYNSGQVDPTMIIPGADLNTGGADGVNSGRMFDVGMNFYFSKYIQFQLSCSRWKAKDGDADANIGRGQLQIQF